MAVGSSMGSTPGHQLSLRSLLLSAGPTRLPDQRPALLWGFSPPSPVLFTSTPVSSISGDTEALTRKSIAPEPTAHQWWARAVPLALAVPLCPQGPSGQEVPLGLPVG